jgi:hypothetical protein
MVKGTKGKRPSVLVKNRWRLQRSILRSFLTSNDPWTWAAAKASELSTWLFTCPVKSQMFQAQLTITEYPGERIDRVEVVGLSEPVG